MPIKSQEGENRNKIPGREIGTQKLDFYLMKQAKIQGIPYKKTKQIDRLI